MPDKLEKKERAARGHESSFIFPNFRSEHIIFGVYLWREGGGRYFLPCCLSCAHRQPPSPSFPPRNKEEEAPSFLSPPLPIRLHRCPPHRKKKTFFSPPAPGCSDGLLHRRRSAAVKRQEKWEMTMLLLLGLEKGPLFQPER